MMLFLDVSALAARYLEVPESHLVRALLREEQGEGCAISQISIPTFSHLLRDLKGEGVPDGILVRAAQAFHMDLPDLVKIQVDTCLAQAGQFTIRHNLRLEPAIQLAGAMALEDRMEFNAKGFPRPMVRMITFNPGLAQAARAEGLPIRP
jgi:hypothetical protein